MFAAITISVGRTIVTLCWLVQLIFS